MADQLCSFCRSIDWEQLLIGPFNPKSAKLDIGQVKCGEHDLGSIRSNKDKCDICRLISDASQSLKPWGPVAEFFDRPERITCAFFNSRNRLGSGPLVNGISQMQVLVDQVYAQLNPKYSSVNLVKQEFLDSLDTRGVVLDGPHSTTADGRRNNTSLNRLLVLAGSAPVSATAQTFMQLHPCLHPVPVVEDFVNGPGPAAIFPTGRIIQPEVNIGLLMKWYTTCLRAHKDTCEQPSWLGPEKAWPQNLRLVDVTQHCIVDAPDRCTYFTLSYVWGSEHAPFQCTSHNLATLEIPGALDVNLLPKTIANAIYLTRALGARYLWIDRLCVLQDSDADKAVQLPQMDAVYARAALTIVGASGTAADGLAGIHGTPRSVGAQRTARAAANLNVMDILRLDESYQSCAWRTRGWTLQEGLCSRRTLLVASTQVFWSCDAARCCESVAFEDFPTTVTPGDSVWRVLSGHAVFGELGGSRNFDYAELRALVAAYNTRRLGVQGDVLSAFAGVLGRVARALGHMFHWGHSVSCLFDVSLAWANIVWYYDADLQNHEIAARRRASHRVLVAAPDGSSYEVPFPSWSWLGWMHLEGLTGAVPRQVNVAPELDIMKLDLDGKAAPLLSPPSTGEKTKLEDRHKVIMNDIDASTSAGWKGNTNIPPHLLHDGGSYFKDSGRLMFWTSLAALETRNEGKIYASADPDREIGELLHLRPYQIPKPQGKFSFVVTSRKFNDLRTENVVVERKLCLLLVEWVDRAACVAERVCAAWVDEGAWVEEERDWVLLTLA